VWSNIIYRSSLLSAALRARGVWRATARSAKVELVLWGCDLQKWKFSCARNTWAQQCECKLWVVQGLTVELVIGQRVGRLSVVGNDGGQGRADTMAHCCNWISDAPRPNQRAQLRATHLDAGISWHGRLAHACRYSDTLPVPATTVALDRILSVVLPLNVRRREQ
jgi:hypothetical protein